MPTHTAHDAHLASPTGGLPLCAKLSQRCTMNYISDVVFRLILFHVFLFDLASFLEYCMCLSSDVAHFYWSTCIGLSDANLILVQNNVPNYNGQRSSVFER